MSINYPNKVYVPQGEVEKMFLKYRNMMFQTKTNQIPAGERETERAFQSTLKTQSSFSSPLTPSSPRRLHDFNLVKASVLLSKCHALSRMQTSLYSLVSSQKQQFCTLQLFVVVCCVTPSRTLLQEGTQKSSGEAKGLNGHHMAGSC